MKYGLYVVRKLIGDTLDGYTNIGDFIQSLAALQYLPNVDEYYDRELKDPGGDDIKMIMNAWYMYNAECFPPSSRVKPLYTSMHIQPNVADAMLSKENVEYLKQYEPIGCRDTGTVERLGKVGVKAYFSGCLTLTLGMTYKSDSRNDRIYFVYPYIPCFSRKKREITKRFAA